MPKVADSNSATSAARPCACTRAVFTLGAARETTRSVTGMCQPMCNTL